MATNTSDFYSYSKSAGTAKNLQKPTVAGDTNVWGTSLNLDLDIVVAAVNAMSDLIADSAEKILIDFTATGSAINHIGITNAAAGNAPSIAAIGGDTNINLTLAPKGSGEVDISKVDIDSGAIDGTAIGASSHSTGKFTTCDATTDFTIGNMVLTDGQIADTGTLALVPVDGLTISLGGDAGDDFNVDSNKLVVEGDTGRCGIGLAGPKSLLHIAPSATGAIPTDQLVDIADENSFTFWNQNNSATYSALKLETRTSAAAGWLVGNEWKSSYNGDLFFRGRYDGTNSREVMRLTSAGNLGIGEPSPNWKCEINRGDASDDFGLVMKAATDGADKWNGIGFGYDQGDDYVKGALIWYGVDGYNHGDFRFCQEKTNDSSNVDPDDVSMIIKSTGKVGIGTDSPSGQLTVSAGSNAPLTLEITDLGGDITLKSTQDDPADDSTIMALRWEAKDDAENNTVYGILNCNVDSDTDGAEKGSINFILANGAGGNSEVMSINGAGVGMGVTTSRGGEWIATFENAHSTNGYGLYVKAADSSGNKSAMMIQLQNGTDVFEVKGNSTTYTVGGTVSSISDQRVKKDVTSLSDGLDILNELRPVKYKFNGENKTPDDGVIRYGLIADEVEEVASQYVDVKEGEINGEEVTDIKTTSMTEMIPMMMKAIQELSAKVTALEAN